MDLRAQSAFLAALVVSVLAIAVSLRAPRRRQATLFAVLAGNLGLWHLADFLLAATGGELFLRIMLAAGSILPFTSHRFFRAFLTTHTVEKAAVNELRTQRLEQMLLGGAAAGTLLSLTPLVRVTGGRVGAAVYAFAALALVLYNVYLQRDATVSRIERARLTYIVVGGAIGLLFAMAGFVPGLAGFFPAVGNVGIVVYLYFLSQTILQHRLLDLNELLGRILVLTILAVVLAVVYAVVVGAVGDRPAVLLFNLVLTSFVLMTLFEPLRARLERAVMAWLFAERFELDRALHRVRRELPGVIDVRSAALHFLERVYETGRITHGSIYALSADTTGYHLLAGRGPEPPTWIDAAALTPVQDAVRSGQKAVLRETVEVRLRDARIAEYGESLAGREPAPTHQESPHLARLGRTLGAMDLMSAGVTVPLVGDDQEVIGVLNLRDERVYEAFSTDEIAAIIAVAEILARLMENTKLYERMRERDRLAALGEMSAGLAHEIRNPLGAIKAAAQYLDPQSLEGDEGEFLQVIIEEVDRLNGVVTQFLDYARPLKATFVATDVNDLVQRTTRLLEREGIPEGVETVLDLAEDLPDVSADPEQIKQVLINLALNAVQAMDGRGRLELRTALRPGAHDVEPGAEGGHGVVEVRVKDSGPGIPPEARDSLFIPFFTTKDRGTGLGLPICQRIARNHGGSLDFHSRPGEGAEFVLRLPVEGAASELPSTERGSNVVPLRRSG